MTEPNAGADDRRVKVSRGKFLGGCSGCNGSLIVRGSRQDYDDWEQLYGCTGWNAESFWPAMLRAETFHTKEWYEPAEASHGTSGPLHVAPHDLAPISNRIMDSMKDQGLPYDSDMFSHGRTAHGCGHSVRTVHEVDHSAFVVCR